MVFYLVNVQVSREETLGTVGVASYIIDTAIVNAVKVACITHVIPSSCRCVMLNMVMIFRRRVEVKPSDTIFFGQSYACIPTPSIFDYKEIENEVR